MTDNPDAPYTDVKTAFELALRQVVVDNVAEPRGINNWTALYSQICTFMRTNAPKPEPTPEQFRPHLVHPDKRGSDKPFTWGT